MRHAKIGFVFVLSLYATARAAGAGRPIELRAWGVPEYAGADPLALSTLAVLNEFQRLHPDIKPVSTTGIQLADATVTDNVVPMMQIAGDVAPHVLPVNFRQTDTYIRPRFLYPLDKYVEREAGVELRGKLKHRMDRRDVSTWSAKPE